MIAVPVRPVHGVEDSADELIRHVLVVQGGSTVHVVFFFQAEDGIRDLTVTGVQTCALPICSRTMVVALDTFSTSVPVPDVPVEYESIATRGSTPKATAVAADEIAMSASCSEIGRASCRGRGEISVVAVSFKKKNMYIGCETQ